jgi:hypothetical protein
LPAFSLLKSNPTPGKCLSFDISDSSLTLWEIFNELERDAGKVTSENSWISFSQPNLIPKSCQVLQLPHVIGMHLRRRKVNRKMRRGNFSFFSFILVPARYQHLL